MNWLIEEAKYFLDAWDARFDLSEYEKTGRAEASESTALRVVKGIKRSALIVRFRRAGITLI